MPRRPFRPMPPLRPLRPLRPIRPRLPPLRPILTPGPMAPPNSIVMQNIHKVNQLLTKGKLNEAAALLLQLAIQAESMGRLRPAANLYAQAALAYALAKNESAALTQARNALIRFTQHNMPQRLAQFLTQVTQALRTNGMPAVADTLQREFGASVQAADAASASTAPRGRLPAQCPHCAGPARSDEVEWIDAHSAECVYCGGVIQTEA